MGVPVPCTSASHAHCGDGSGTWETQAHTTSTACGQVVSKGQRWWWQATGSVRCSGRPGVWKTHVVVTAFGTEVRVDVLHLLLGDAQAVSVVPLVAVGARDHETATKVRPTTAVHWERLVLPAAPRQNHGHPTTNTTHPKITTRRHATVKLHKKVPRWAIARKK